MYKSIRPGQVWLDTQGNRIQAHGGSILAVGDAFYWYGENKEKTLPGSGIWHYGVRMYKSKDLRKLLPQADFVMMCVPATDHTKHLLGKKEIGLMRKGTGFINYSRADLVDYDALRKRLIKNELTAILDVFNPEPLPSSSPLWKTPNLIMTPHCSSDDTERYTPKTLDLVFGQMQRFIAGRKLTNVVDRHLEY